MTRQSIIDAWAQHLELADSARVALAEYVQAVGRARSQNPELANKPLSGYPEDVWELNWKWRRSQWLSRDKLKAVRELLGDRACRVSDGTVLVPTDDGVRQIDEVLI